MRRRSLAATLVVTAAGLVASAALRRVTARRRAALAGKPAAVPAVPPVAEPAADLPVGQDAVVLAFSPRVATEPARPAAPARCGESGGRTKAGAPCAARATSGGRCHHHPLAA